MKRVAVACTTEQTILGEGARWDIRREELLRVDIVAGRVFRDRVTDDGSLVPVRTYQVPDMVGAITPVAGDDGWLLAAGRGFAYLSREGIYQPIEEVAPAGTRMNDAACDPQGRLWAGTLADDHHVGGGALYRLDCRGQIELVLSGLTITNGLGWSPDGATMYVVDSGPRLIHVFDFDVDRGIVARGRVLVTLAEEVGAPDGLTVDAAGDLWVAVYGGGCVRRYSPEGALRETLTVPAAAEHFVRVRRSGAAPAVRHHRDRELERRGSVAPNLPRDGSTGSTPTRPGAPHHRFGPTPCGGTRSPA